jgi:hypothetical protein
MRARTALALPVIVVAGALLVSGCSANESSPSRSESQSEQQSAAASSAPSATPPGGESTEQSEVDPDGTALDNREYFDAAIAEVLARDQSPTSEQLVDALADAGFTTEAMQVTADETAVGLEVDAIEVSVEFDESCVIGQFGEFGYRSAVMPLLATGECLVGSTVPIER